MQYRSQSDYFCRNLVKAVKFGTYRAVPVSQSSPPHMRLEDFGDELLEKFVEKIRDHFGDIHVVLGGRNSGMFLTKYVPYGSFQVQSCPAFPERDSPLLQGHILTCLISFALLQIVQSDTDFPPGRKWRPTRTRGLPFIVSSEHRATPGGSGS